MAGRFRGDALHKVDTKGRVSIPAAFRRVLEEGDPDWAEGRAPGLFMIVRFRNMDCIECYSIRAMLELERDLDAVTDWDLRERLLDEITARSHQISLDENGRIVLSPRVRTEAGIEQDAYFLGKLDKFQIWDPEAYQAYRAQPRDDPFRQFTRQARGGA